MKYEYQGKQVELPAQVRKYLKAVEKKLRLPREIRRSVLSDLLTGIYARLEKGEPAECVLENMGTAQQVAQGINEEMDEFVYVKSPWRWGCLAVIVCSSVVLLMQGTAGVWLALLNISVNSLGKLGGADGPTRILVTTAPEMQLKSMVVAGILLLMGILGFVKLSRCQKKQE